MQREPGQECACPLEVIGRHRVCLNCVRVYSAIAGPNELIPLGAFAGIEALVREYRDLQQVYAAQQQQRKLVQKPGRRGRVSDTFSEDCCWNDVRDMCQGTQRGCKCHCHGNDKGHQCADCGLVIARGDFYYRTTRAIHYHEACVRCDKCYRVVQPPVQVHRMTCNGR